METSRLRLDQLLRPAEQFRVLLEIDHQWFALILTAYNAASISALLQSALLLNRERMKGYVIRREGTAELVASVEARGFVGAMTSATRLKDPPPSDPPKTRLPEWSLVNMRVDKPMDEKAKPFTLDIVIDGIVEKGIPVTGPNAESLISLLTIATVEKMPRIGGWNLYDGCSGELLASVPVMDFINMLAEKTVLGKAPADPKAAGWRALPVLTPTSEEWQKMVEQAKKEGRVPK
jgi:hypothetical protein